MRTKVIRKGMGIAGLKKRMLKNGYVTVGIHRKEGKHDDSELTVANIAAKHEFGLGGMPERSFMRSTMFQEKKRIKKELKKAAVLLANGKGFDSKVKKLGEHLRGKIIAKINSIKTPPNSPGTIAKKGVDNPLVDSGQMKQSIHSVFHKKKPK